MSLLRIRRLKYGKLMYAVRSENSVVVEWTVSAASAGHFDRETADGVLARIAAAAEQERPTGRVSIVPLNGDTEIAGAGVAIEEEPRLEQNEATGEVTLGDGEEIRYLPGIPPADIVPDANRPVLRLAFASRPFSPARIAIIREHADYSAAVTEAVAKPDSAAAPWFAIEKQIRDHDAATASAAAAARESLETLRAEREAEERDGMARPGLAARLREIDGKIAEAKQVLADHGADRGLLQQLLARHRPAAVRAIREANAAARKARQRELREQACELAGHVAAAMAEELAAIHEVWCALFDIERSEFRIAEDAAVLRLLGPDAAA
jgi:hypothetical protein